MAMWMSRLGRRVNAARAMSGMIFARAKEIIGEVVTGIQPQRARQPDGEEAAALFKMRLIYALLPAEDGGSFGNRTQVIVGVRHQLRPAPEQSLHGARGGQTIRLAPAYKTQQAPPLFAWVRGKIANFE